VNGKNGTAPTRELGDLEPLVTAGEFRQLLKVSDRTFRRWVSGGIVPHPDLVLGSAARWHLRTVRRVLGQGESDAVRPRLVVGR
jgi:hypothetical protein